MESACCAMLCMALFPTVYIAYASHISLLHLRSASITLPLRRSRILSLYPRLLITANHHLPPHRPKELLFHDTLIYTVNHQTYHSTQSSGSPTSPISHPLISFFSIPNQLFTSSVQDLSISWLAGLPSITLIFSSLVALSTAS